MADLDHLRSFLAIYRAGSLTRASRAAHLTQPALSLQLKALEADLGRRLFTRLPRGLDPTAAGHDLARAVAPHIDALAAVAEGVRAGSEQVAGTVALGGPAEFLTLRGVPALAPLVDRGLHLRFRFGLTAALVERLDAGEMDLVVATERVARRGVDYERLCEEEFALVAGRVWAARVSRKALESRGAQALEGAPLVAYAEDLPIVRRYWRAVFGTRAAIRASVVAPDLRAVMAAVAAGAGVTVLPRYLCGELLARGELTELWSPAKAPRNVLYLASRAGARHPRVGLVVEMLRRAAAGW